MPRANLPRPRNLFDWVPTVLEFEQAIYSYERVRVVVRLPTMTRLPRALNKSFGTNPRMSVSQFKRQLQYLLGPEVEFSILNRHGEDAHGNYQIRNMSFD